jgi:exonuclease VII small subunit
MSNVDELKKVLTAMLDCDTSEQEHENFHEVVRLFKSLEAKLEAAEKRIAFLSETLQAAEGGIKFRDQTIKDLQEKVSDPRPF